MTDSLLERYYFEKSFGLKTDNIEKDNIEDNRNEKEQFDLLCTNKVYEGDPTPEEMLSRTKFINITDRINIRHPFLILLEFVEDFFAGEYSKDLIKKYHILNYVELNYTLENILKLVGNRTKKHIKNSSAKNFSNKEWLSIYEFIVRNSQHFRSEQLYLVNYNILRAAIIIYLFKSSEKISANDLNLNLRFIVEEVMDKINILRVPGIRNSFLKFIDGNVGHIIDTIVNELKNKNFFE